MGRAGREEVASCEESRSESEPIRADFCENEDARLQLCRSSHRERLVGNDLDPVLIRIQDERNVLS